MPFPGPGRGQGGGEPARPQPHHQVRLPRSGRAHDHHVAGAGGGRDGEDGVPAVTDGADGAADRDPAAPREQRNRAGRLGQAPRGADLAFPLAGVEGDRGRRHDPAQPGGDRVGPPRPRQAGQREPGRDRERRQQQERPGEIDRGQVGPAARPGVHRRQRDRVPRVQPRALDGEPDPGREQRPGRGPAQPRRRPAPQPRRPVPHGRHDRDRPRRDHECDQQQPPGHLDHLAEQPQAHGQLQPRPHAHDAGPGANAAAGRPRTTTRGCSPAAGRAGRVALTVPRVCAVMMSPGFSRSNSSLSRPVCPAQYEM